MKPAQLAQMYRARAKERKKSQICYEKRTTLVEEQRFVSITRLLTIFLDPYLFRALTLHLNKLAIRDSYVTRSLLFSRFCP